jgi:hypothetical protein
MGRRPTALCVRFGAAVWLVAFGACHATSIRDQAEHFDPKPDRTPYVFDVEASELTLSCAYGNDAECDQLAVVVRDVLFEALNQRLTSVPKTTLPARVRLQLVETGNWNTACSVLSCFSLFLFLPLVPETVYVSALADVQVGDMLYHGEARGQCTASAMSYTQARHCAAGEGAMRAIEDALKHDPVGGSPRTASLGGAP